MNVNLANVPTETWNARCYKAARVQNNSGKDMKIIHLFIVLYSQKDCDFDTFKWF